ncbi:MAG: hypothetical protein AAF416_22925, partial [Pseudomonadota bacterium]
GPIGASSTPSRFRHFAMVFGFTPYFRLSAAVEAADRCIAARTACVRHWPQTNRTDGGSMPHRGASVQSLAHSVSVA